MTAEAESRSTDRDGTARLLVKQSKRLSLVLRHRPGAIGITLDRAGWTDIAALLAALAAHGTGMSRADLDAVVAGNDKQRFAVDQTGTRIRANQGHTVPVELGYPPEAPPPLLYHGTVAVSLTAIFAQGLLPGTRHDVHLSGDTATARQVGSRRGAPVILAVDAAAMAADGHVFRRSANGVWLTAAVPPRYLRRVDATR
jgi:putative RNA 2'-phosphotransferase